VILAVGVPLWSAYLALRLRGERDRFGPPSSDERFVARYLAQRTLAATVAPVFQLVFIVELVSYAVDRVRRGQTVGADTMLRISAEVRAQWAQSLVVILIFLFGYLFFLSSEVRFARQLDRYELLVARPVWEAVWPFFLIFLLLFTLGTTHVLDWALAGHSSFGTFVRRHVMAQPLDLIEMGKTLVFQGTFLSALVLAMLLLTFTPAEVLAALRLPFQPADEAAVRHRTQYFVRSMAIFRVARVSWLYGGAMIGGLTAMTILSQPVALPLVKQVLYILTPSLVGFVGYGITRRQVKRFLAHAPAVERSLDRQVQESQLELARIAEERLRNAPWRHRILQLVVPFVCVAVFLVWTGSGIHERAIQKLVMPVTAQGWLLILPYALLVPILLARDFVQLLLVRRRLKKDEAEASAQGA
jgi:hypothetical protein